MSWLTRIFKKKCVIRYCRKYNMKNELVIWGYTIYDKKTGYSLGHFRTGFEHNN